MDFVRDFVDHARSIDLDSATDLDKEAAEVVDWVYAEVSFSGARPNPDPSAHRRLAHRPLQVVDKTGLVTGQSNFEYRSADPPDATSGQRCAPPALLRA